MVDHIFLYIFSFVVIWVGTGLAIKSVEHLSRSLKLSSFAISFLVLGFFTSVSELSVGVNSILENDPEIYVGNLIGASIVIFMMIIPLLAITGGRIQITKEFRGYNLVMSLIVIVAPVVLAIDGNINTLDSIISLILYGILVLGIQSQKGLIEKAKDLSHLSPIKTSKELVKIVLGVSMIFIASRFVVNQTIYFSQIFHVSPFLISLLLVSVGTNIPELSFVVRSMFIKNNQIAFGDYVGSAAFNTCLFGLLTLWYGRPVFLINSYLISMIFLIIGLLIFYYFARTRNAISRREGFGLLTLYILFLIIEFTIH